MTTPASGGTGPAAGLTLTAVAHTSGLDGRRGVVRLHTDVLAALGLRAWDPLRLQGRRVTGALAAFAPPDAARGELRCDDLVLANLGVSSGQPVQVSPGEERAALRVAVSGPREVAAGVPPDVLRLALLGKIVTEGDQVSLLPQDFALPLGAAGAGVLDVGRRLATSVGVTWTSVVLTVEETAPGGPALVTMATEVAWRAGAATQGSALVVPSAGGAAAPALADLPGLERQAQTLREWFELGFTDVDLLRRLGGTPQLGVLVSGPPGSGKSALVAAVAAAVGARVVRLWGAQLGGTEADAAARAVTAAADEVLRTPPAVLLLEDAEAVAPRERGGGVLPVLLDTVDRVAGTGAAAVVATTSRPEDVSTDLRHPGRLDREIRIGLPTRNERHRILAVLTRSMPLAPDVDLAAVAGRTPGFVAADLLALCRETALRAANRVRSAGAAPSAAAADVQVLAADFASALQAVRPTSMRESSLELPGLSLDDVGDMAEVKEAVTETVLWPLRYPDTFSRLGIRPPHGLLLYGPPGCGKTYLVKAIAGTGQANVLSVKGAELLSKWVGESERAVRELFRRAREAAPAMVFLDEVDALAPVRGQASDSGVGDRVVAALLTELDGVEELRDVVVLGATNRPDLVDPALLRPGRLDQLVYVPPPDATARTEILRSAARHVPLAPDVDLAALGASVDGYSSADCAALIREAAMTAMRESLEVPAVTAAHVAAARDRVRPSLRAEQVSSLAAFAASRGQA